MEGPLTLPSSLRLPSPMLFLHKQPMLLRVPITNPITLFPPSQHRLHRTQHLQPHSVQKDSFQFDTAGPNDDRRKPSSTGREPPELRRTLFPGGYKRPEIKIPSIVLQLSAEDVLEDGSVLDVVDGVVSKWVGLVVLTAGDGGGGKLYKAACLLKSVIRDRAYLLIFERVDIASAVDAGGVVLSDQGLPAIVARNTMLDSKSESVLLPIVGRSVRSVDAAVSASNSEGADFLIFSTITEELSVPQLESVSSSVKIPIFVALADPLSLNKASSVLQSGASGLIIKLEELKLFSDETLTTLLYETTKTTSRHQDKLQSFAKPEVLGGVAGIVKADDDDDAKVQFVKQEKRVLAEAIDVIQKAAPLMEEVSLLSDAIGQLDDPFLLVIVGEFNSGKSSVINALLGGRFLEEGVVPTTNEITFLRYSELSSDEQQQCERHPGGQYICYLPAEILKEMIIVDTPGTNVILQRQQRLTEEFVPRADLLLFVMSADRPLTESEVSFLRYTQQWKKNVVFILNKSDLYRSPTELEEGVNFVKENVGRLLNTENVMLYPVSARSALAAKLLSPDIRRIDHEELVMTEQSITTRSFYEFEKFLCGLLDGSTPEGHERKKMKLETPIRIAERLLSSCQTVVTQECRYAKQELTALSNLINSVEDYAKKMESDSLSWRKNILSMMDATKRRAVKLLDSILQLSNLELGASLIIKRERSSLTPAALAIQNDIVNPALSDAKKLLEEYGSWLQENNVDEGRQYKASFEKKWSHLIESDSLMPELDLDIILRGEGDKLGVKAIEKLGSNDVSKLFEEEIRDAFLGAFGGLGAAGLSASLLTSVLPTTMEDLLALGLCSLGGYVAISNFPARKRKTIVKVNKIGDIVRVEIEEAMVKDLKMTTERMEIFVREVGKPYQEAAQARVDKLLEIQDELSSIEKKLRSLQIELQNLRLS